MNTNIQKWKQLYRINFFQPKTKDDKNPIIDPIVITQDGYNLIKEDVKNNKWIEVNDCLYNPFTIRNIEKYQVDESVETYLKMQPESVQKKVKDYMKYEKKDTNLQRLEAMIEKAREELYLK